MGSNKILGRVGLTIGLIGFIAGGVIVPVGILVTKSGIPLAVGAASVEKDDGETDQ